MEGQLRKIIAQNIGVAFVDCEDEKTLEELGATELEITEIIIALEEAIENQLDDDMVTADKTVGEIVKYAMEVKNIVKEGEINDSQESSGGSREGEDKE